jgi:uncharacterized integral membrane protein (TIGR00698 family)
MKVMMARMVAVSRIVPGLVVALLVAVAARSLAALLPVHVISASVMALFIGMFLRRFLPSRTILASGLNFTSKRVLRLAIVLLGASLSIGTIVQVGKISLAVMVFTLLACFGGGYFLGRVLRLNWKLSNLISAGTGICGGSAIAAIAPAIDADDQDIAYAMSATFLFDMAMIVLFPLMGRALGLSDMAYGLWAGTAVNDTSSVVAAGYAFSEAAGDFATMVKLTRTLTIIPTVIIFSLVHARMQHQALAARTRSGTFHGHVQVKALIPWFIVGFVVLALVNSAGVVPADMSAGAKETSKFLMIAALAAIGLKTDLRELHRAGFNPMLHGLLISTLVVVVALAVQYLLGVL